MFFVWDFFVGIKLYQILNLPMFYFGFMNKVYWAYKKKLKVLKLIICRDFEVDTATLRITRTTLMSCFWLSCMQLSNLSFTICDTCGSTLKLDRDG